MADVISVSALNKYVKSLLEDNEVLTGLAIQGEVSNFTCHYKTGHCYFSLKDDKASVSAVMFRSYAARLRFEVQNGMQVMARCRVSLYERDGRFQLYVEDLFPAGAGALQMAFEQLKQKLAAEGLFAPERKKPLPAHPARVGLVTSKTGAALQDILKVAATRCPAIHFVLHPVTVQGMDAAGEIAAAIARLDARGDCDVIVVARGGGSAEDLWVFNAEEIARAAFAAKTPIVSAIGHEVDFTILDFVADMRAPTPSAAAEMVLPDLSHTWERVLNLYANIQSNMHYRMDSWYNRLTGAEKHTALAKAREIPAVLQQQLRHTIDAIFAQMQAKATAGEGRLQAAAALAHSLSPYAVMARGYAAACHSGQPLRSIEDVAEGDEVDLTLADGHLTCEVKTITPGGAEVADGTEHA